MEDIHRAIECREAGFAGGVNQEAEGDIQQSASGQMLLKSDADGPCWTDAEIADACGCRTKTVENTGTTMSAQAHLPGTQLGTLR